MVVHGGDRIVHIFGQWPSGDWSCGLCRGGNRLFCVGRGLCPVLAGQSHAHQSLLRNSVVPPGLESCVPLFPALKRWANIGSSLRDLHYSRYYSQRWKRWANIGRPSGAEIVQLNSHWVAHKVSFATASGSAWLI